MRGPGASRILTAMATPRSAAAIILYREKPKLEVFWARRALSMIFQGGFHAFPGGQLDPNEDSRVCAVRELKEETGVDVDPTTLVDVGRWVTPPFVPRRFDTCFFLARCPEGQAPKANTEEHDFGGWVEPAAALEQWRDTDLLTSPPVLHALQCLSQGLENIEGRMKAAPEAQGNPTVEVEMRKGILLVPVRTPTLPPATHTNCYVIGDKDVIVIDPASPYPEEQEVLDRVIEKRGLRVREIWLTHMHRDHVSGANHLKEWTRAPIVAHPITARDLAGFVDVDREFAVEERVRIEGDPGWRLRVLHTPGHARGHVCVLEEKKGSLITGDLMAGFGTIVIDPPEGHMATYLGSLRKMQQLNVTALFPAHGPVMANAKKRIQDYIDHRGEREANILKAWDSGVRDVPKIVEAVYADVAPAMYGLAGRSVEAHLEKLREEGKISGSDQL